MPEGLRLPERRKQGWIQFCFSADFASVPVMRCITFWRKEQKELTFCFYMTVRFYDGILRGPRPFLLLVLERACWRGKSSPDSKKEIKKVGVEVERPSPFFFWWKILQKNLFFPPVNLEKRVPDVKLYASAAAFPDRSPVFRDLWPGSMNLEKM